MRKIRIGFSLLGLAFSTFWMRKKQMFLVTVLIMLLMTILQILLAQYETSVYAVYEMRDTWKVDTEETYHLGMAVVMPDDMGYTDRLYAFLDEAQAVAGVRMLGKFYWNGTPEDGRQGISYLRVDRELLEFAQIDLDESTAPNGIFLGADFRGQYQPGDVFQENYIVEGFLPEGARWPSNSRLLENEMHSTYSLDGCGVLLLNDEQEHGLLEGFFINQCVYFTLEEKADIGTVRQELLRLSEKYNVGAYVESLEELYSKYLQKNDLVRGKYRVEIALALVVSILTITTAHLISFWILRDFYGVLYACGYTQNNMIEKMGIESCTIFVFALGLSFLFMQKYYAPSMRDIRYWYEAWSRLVIPRVLCISGVIWLLSNLIPAVYIRRKTPWSLLKEK